MQLITEATDFQNAVDLINKKFENIVLGCSEFGLRNLHNFNQEEILHLNSIKGSSKIWVKMNSFIFDEDLIKLSNKLKLLDEIKIDFVIFQDYSIPQIIYENNLGIKVHYNPETLNTNYGQFHFFEENKISGCFIAREITIKELEEICLNKKGLKIEIQAFGLGFIMHSRWKLVTNFDDYYKSKIHNNEFIKIKEELRAIPNIISEDRHGTHMFTGYIINLISLLPKLKEIGVDLIQLNLFKLPKNYNQIIDVYKSAMSDLQSNNFNEEKYLNDINNIVKNDFLLSKGFLGGIKENLHLNKVGTKDE
ncbi:MAG: U32 family peptidase [Mycoplasma sp.]